MFVCLFVESHEPRVMTTFAHLFALIQKDVLPLFSPKSEFVSKPLYIQKKLLLFFRFSPELFHYTPCLIAKGFGYYFYDNDDNKKDTTRKGNKAKLLS